MTTLSTPAHPPGLASYIDMNLLTSHHSSTRVLEWLRFQESVHHDIQNLNERLETGHMSLLLDFEAVGPCNFSSCTMTRFLSEYVEISIRWTAPKTGNMFIEEKGFGRVPYNGQDRCYHTRNSMKWGLDGKPWQKFVTKIEMRAPATLEKS